MHVFFECVNNHIITLWTEEQIAGFKEMRIGRSGCTRRKAEFVLMHKQQVASAILREHYAILSVLVEELVPTAPTKKPKNSRTRIPPRLKLMIQSPGDYHLFLCVP